MKEPENIKDAMRQLRQALGGLTQERFARKLGITVRTAARWEASDTLSPQTLTQLRSLALGASEWALADWFETRIREDLDLRPDDEDLGDAAPMPGTPEERDLVAEFLRRYRESDAAIQPVVEQLWAWIGERDATAEAARRKPRKPVPLRERIKKDFEPRWTKEKPKK